MEECYLDAVSDADAKTYINGFAESALGYYDSYYCGAGKVCLFFIPILHSSFADPRGRNRRTPPLKVPIFHFDLPFWVFRLKNQKTLLDQRPKPHDWKISENCCFRAKTTVIEQNLKFSVKPTVFKNQIHGFQKPKTTVFKNQNPPFQNSKSSVFEI